MNIALTASHASDDGRVSGRSHVDSPGVPMCPARPAAGSCGLPTARTGGAASHSSSWGRLRTRFRRPAGPPTLSPASICLTASGLNSRLKLRFLVLLLRELSQFSLSHRRDPLQDAQVWKLSSPSSVFISVQCDINCITFDLIFCRSIGI